MGDLGSGPGKELSVAASRRGATLERCVQPCLVELLGSALFVFVGCLSVIGNPLGAGLLQPALAHGLALGLLVATLGNVSGGHFNPAVSLAVVLIGGLELTVLPPYWTSQLCGALLGACLAKAVSPEESFWNASVTVQEPGQVAGAVVAELVLTTLLALAVCTGAVNEKTRSPLAPFAVGFSVTVGVLAGGTVSGGCLNPARAFGPAVLAQCWHFHWIYWLGPLLASLLVGALLRFFIGDAKTRIFLKG